MTPKLIKKARQKLGYSQIAMAKALGIGRRTYQERESGESEVTVMMWLAVQFLLLRDKLK